METTAESMWSPVTYKLKDIVDRIPTLVKVAEGIYGHNEATSFSQGDLIRLDSCAPLHRISAYLAQPGRNTRYEKFGKEINLPYNYNGRVKVQPMHKETHEYLSVSDLITYFPRYVRVQNKVIFQHPPGYIQTLEEGDVLTLKAVRRSQLGVTNSLRCTRDGKDIVLPRQLRGVFQILPDDDEQTIRDVVETYKLPQCVRFIGRGVQEIMSKDLQEAVDNMDAFSGDMIIMGKTTSPPVLFGHYKGVDSVTSASTLRRAAVVIPLHSKHVEDLDVHLPIMKHSNNYEQFLVKVFPAFQEKSSILEDALYADFSTTSNIQFLSSDARTDDPSKEESKSNTSSASDSPPPLPPRLALDIQPADDTNKNRTLPVVKVAPFCQTEQTASVSEENSKTEKPNVYPKPSVTDVDQKLKGPVLKSSLESSVKPAPQDTVIQRAPQENVIQPAPQGNVIQPAPQGNVIRPAPQDTVIQPAPQGNVIQPAPQGNVIKPAPQGNDIKPAPQENVIKPNPQGNVIKPTPQGSVISQMSKDPSVKPQGPIVKPTPQSTSVRPVTQSPPIKPKPQVIHPGLSVRAMPNSLDIKPTLTPVIRPPLETPTEKQTAQNSSDKPAQGQPLVKQIPKDHLVKPTPQNILGKPSPKESPLKPSPQDSCVKPTQQNYLVMSIPKGSPIKSTQDSLDKPTPGGTLGKSTPQGSLVKPRHLSKSSSLPSFYGSVLVGDAFSKPSEEMPEEEEANVYEMPVEEQIYETIDEKSEGPVKLAKTPTYKRKVKRAFSDLYRNVQPVIKVIQRLKPISSKNQHDDGEYDYIRTNNVPISELGISELHVVLMDCGMPDLARVCKQERVDGGLFVSFTPEIMKTRPFCLSDWNLIKAQKVQKGWMPKE